MNKKTKIFPVLLRKTGIFIGSVVVLTILVFSMARLAPGDPLVSYYGERAERMTPQEKEKAMERLGLNKPISVQYISWIKNACKGDFGLSYKYKEDVLQIIKGRAQNTLLLGGVGFVLTFTLSLATGIFCAYREGKQIDTILCKIGTFTSCIPEFWISLVLILVFSVNLQWLPSSGAYGISEGDTFISRLTHLILPLVVVVMSHLWYYAYLIRNRLAEEMRKDYVFLAMAKGLSKKKCMLSHCLRNIMPTFISLMAMSVPHILGGTYIVETVFSYPGIGTLSFESAKYHDYNMLMVLCLLTGVVVILGNMIGEAVSQRIDPRMR